MLEPARCRDFGAMVSLGLCSAHPGRLSYLGSVHAACSSHRLVSPSQTLDTLYCLGYSTRGAVYSARLSTLFSPVRQQLARNGSRFAPLFLVHAHSTSMLTRI